MKRFLGAFLLAGTVAVAAGACDDSSSGDYYGNGGGDDCSANTTCDTCTPVQGCGWCFNAGGGVCASSPDECAAATSEFTWTWSQSGCPDVDASISGRDAAATTTEASAPQPDSGSSATDTGAASIEASAGDAGGG